MSDETMEILGNENVRLHKEITQLKADKQELVEALNKAAGDLQDYMFGETFEAEKYRVIANKHTTQ